MTIRALGVVFIALCFICILICISSDPPDFIEPETETVEMSSGDKIILNCTAVANPMPEYSWQSPSSTQQRMENESVVTSSLLLPGTYNCTASNTYGSKTKLFIITQKPGKTLLLKSRGFSAALLSRCVINHVILHGVVLHQVVALEPLPEFYWLCSLL